MAQSQTEYTFEERYENIENVADTRREEIVFGETVDWDAPVGGIIRFAEGDYADGEPLLPETVRQLAEEGFLSLEQRYNAAPTIKEMVEHAEAMNERWGDVGVVRLIGYMVSPERSDCRITIEGARFDGDVTPGVYDDFVERFGDGYEFSHSATHLRRWHD